MEFWVMVLCAVFHDRRAVCVSTEAWKIGYYTGASSVAKFFKRKVLHSLVPAAVLVFVHWNVFLTSSIVMTFLSEVAGITVLSISVHLTELSSDSNLVKKVIGKTKFIVRHNRFSWRWHSCHSFHGIPNLFEVIGCAAVSLPSIWFSAHVLSVGVLQNLCFWKPLSLCL